MFCEKLGKRKLIGFAKIFVYKKLQYLFQKYLNNVI